MFTIIICLCACGCEDEINAAIEKYSESKEKYRGMMVYEKYGEELMKIHLQLQEQTEDEDMDETENMDITM